MQIIPEETETVIQHHVCEHHKTHPQGDGFAGCTCSSVYMTKPKTAEVPPSNSTPLLLPKKYGSVSCGVAESNSGDLLMISDVIKALDHALDDDEYVVSRIDELLCYLRQ